MSLIGITWDHLRGYGPLDVSVKAFEKRTGIKVTWERRSLKDFGDASIEILASEYDLIIMDHPHSGQAASLQCLVPFDEILSKEILSDFSINSAGPSFESYHYQDHQWALPIDGACQVASYRKDLLSQPLPGSWHEVFELALYLKPRKQYVGMTLCSTDSMCSFLTLCAQYGDAPSVHNDFMITKNAGLHALNMLKQLNIICHPESSSWNPIDLYDYMTNENDVVYCPLAFGYVNYASPGYAQNQLHFGGIPGKKGALLGGAGIAISKHCKNIPVAALYASWLCGEKFQSGDYVTAGGQPAHKKAWTSESVNKMSGSFFEDTFSTIEKAYVRPRTPEWPAFQEILGDIIHLYLKYDIDIKKTWEEIMDSYNYCFK